VSPLRIQVARATRTAYTAAACVGSLLFTLGRPYGAAVSMALAFILAAATVGIIWPKEAP
jgi:hypothetical protein